MNGVVHLGLLSSAALMPRWLEYCFLCSRRILVEKVILIRRLVTVVFDVGTSSVSFVRCKWLYSPSKIALSPCHRKHSGTFTRGC